MGEKKQIEGDGLSADWKGADIDHFERFKREWREKYGVKEGEETKEDQVVELLHEILYKLETGDYVDGSRVSED